MKKQHFYVVFSNKTLTYVCLDDIVKKKEDGVMEIKKIEKLKSGKYKIHFTEGDTVTTYDSVILKQNLLYHKRITKEEYASILRETGYYASLDEIIKKISKKYRSEKEIRDFLKEKEVENEEEIIHYLKENHFLNDEVFAKSYIHDRAFLSSDGPCAIFNDLKKHNIKDEIIYKYLNEIEEDVWNQKMDKMIQKKTKPNTSPYMQKQKIINDLISKGFEKEKILDRMNNFSFSSEGIVKDYQKLKLKLEKKYEGSNLDFEIKKRLYQKGYSSNDIDDYLS